MAVETARDRLTEGRQIRLAKPEEGEARGEVFHLLRALLVVVAVTAVIGWVVS